MFRVVETFSGIGSQAKALKNINKEYEIVNTCDWDINAIIAYDAIHHGTNILPKYEEMSKEDIMNILEKYTLSLNGKVPATIKSIEKLSLDILKRLITAIERTKNLVSITDVKSNDLPDEFELLTYSFPCQDLSNAGFWHGNKGGIDRNANNRSSMLWQVERILIERNEIIKENKNVHMPRFLLMENVTSILSKRNIDNFNEWKASLRNLGYVSQEISVNAIDCGSVQKRKRTYMLSVYTEDCNEKVKEKIITYLMPENFESFVAKKEKYTNEYRYKKLYNEVMKLDYSNKTYLEEAIKAQPNNTISRRRIYEQSVKILDENKNKIKTGIIPTVTTKQDRHPNSGVIYFKSKSEKKSSFRYLTPRECFLLMGFSEEDYQKVVDGDVKKSSRGTLFTTEKLYKMAGNSIVVNVLENVFKYVDKIEKECLVPQVVEEKEYYTAKGQVLFPRFGNLNPGLV